MTAPPPRPPQNSANLASLDDTPVGEIELTEDFDDGPTHSDPRRCPGCAGQFIELEGDLWIPTTYEQAWGAFEGACRGSRDPHGAWWCKRPAEPLTTDRDGRLVIPDKMEIHFFPDRGRR